MRGQRKGKVTGMWAIVLRLLVQAAIWVAGHPEHVKAVVSAVHDARLEKKT